MTTKKQMLSLKVGRTKNMLGCIVTEFSLHQYEMTCRPTFGVAVADWTVNVREINRETARQMNRYASFSSKLEFGLVMSWLYRNREAAALHISPTVSVGDESIAKQYNLEFRPMDATASPHSAIVDVDPHKRTGGEREERGIVN